MKPELIQSGPRDAYIVAVGESPGRNEIEQGKPFVGAAGEILDRAFTQANRALGRTLLLHHELFITNLAHIQPPGNDFDYFLHPQLRPELMLGILQLKKDLEEIRPNLIIALGNMPLRFLTGKEGIGKWRGSILPCTLVSGLKVVATFHPASILRVYDNNGVFQTDIRRCAEESLTPELNLPKRDFYIDPIADVRNELILEMCRAEWLSIDIETVKQTDGTWHISCVGFSDYADRAMILPWNSSDNRLAIAVLCSCQAKKIFQNGMYDISVLLDNGIKVKNVVWDIMYGHHALYPECGGSDDEVTELLGTKRVARSALMKKLEFQTSIYTREPFYKDDKYTDDLPTFYTYNGRDAAVTREIRDVQERELRDFGTIEVFEHEMALQPLLMHMTRAGIQIDTVEMNRLKAEYEEKIGRLQDFLDKGAGRSVNVKSPDVKWLLFEKLGLPVSKRSEKTDKPSADKYVIEALNTKHPHPLLGAILEIRSLRDLIERYLDTKLDADNRWRASFDPTGTRTGRLASRSNIYGTSNNIQNIPERIRRMFVADPGKILFSIDYSQAEARVVAWLARCESLIGVFNSGQDIHSRNAARFFNLEGTDYEIKTLQGGLRFAAKRIVHGSNYGMQAQRLIESANDDARRTGSPHRLTLDIARRGQEMYFLLYPEIKDNFWREVREALRDTRTLNTPFGRKRQFFGRWDEKLMNEAYAFVPQSTVGDLACKAMIRLWDNDKEQWKLRPGAELLANGHDSLIGQCKIEDIRWTVAMVRKAMDIPMLIHRRELRIPTDVEVGHNWSDYNEQTNPDGLMELSKWLQKSRG